MEKILTEELLKQIKLINYDRYKTLIENDSPIIKESSDWAKTKEGISTIKFLTSLGHDINEVSNASSANNAYNRAAISALRKISDKLVSFNYSITDSFFKISVLHQSSHPKYSDRKLKPAGGVQKWNSFNLDMIEKLNDKLHKGTIGGTWDGGNYVYDDDNPNRTLAGTFLLEDLYFNYGDVYNTVKDLNSSSNYLFPDGVWSFFTQWAGTDNIRQVLNSISSQNATSKPVYNKEDGEIESTKRPTSEPDYEEIVQNLHIILPIVALVVDIFGGPPGMVVGAALETIDAGLYQFYDQDPYMAGLSLVFALVPLGELSRLPGFKEVTKIGVEEGLEKLLWKKVRNEPLEESEELFLREVTQNPTVMKEFNQAVVNASMRKLLVQNPKGYIDVLTSLAQKGFLAYDKLFTIINLILGTVTWDFIAYKFLPQCSAKFKFSDLIGLIPDDTSFVPSSGLKKPLSLIELQPFTETSVECEKIVQKQLQIDQQKIINEYMRNYQSAAIGTLRSLIYSKSVLSSSVDMGFQFEVGVIQSILYQCGFTKKDILIQFKDGKFIFNSASRVNKVIITSAQGRIFETITNDGKNKFYSKQLKDGVYIVLISTSDSDKPLSRKFIINKQVTGPYNFTSESEKFNWGYYDEKTEKSVEEFQKYFNLNVDGVAGVESFKKMLDLVKNEKCGVLQNKSGIEFTDANEQLINNAIVQSYYESLKNLKVPTFDEENLTPKQQREIDNRINKYLNVPLNDVEDTLIQVEEKLNN